MDTDTPLTHKTKTIGCKVTEEEYDKFVKLADSANLTISEYFRAAIMNNETFVVQKEIMSKDKRNLIYLFNKTSNNMNQLAKSVNIAHNSGNMNEKLSLQVLRELQLIRIALHTYIESC
ncbi:MULTISPECIES: plasmid mobilization protein [Photobacterium]|uniref:Plasmid mobilization relaxosome protein MobC n=1 Tax=Photobacterium carnosum TaxID=2023717 RepID=A0A2N4UML6_9GAMM|nr:MULTISPECIES: hypothetical protein [Photobacterium]KAE8175732.1 hypothetical protein CIT27_16865 [Photobacterium carnosum]MBY3790400.1 mobilization protein [Photobacterium carnosum]MCD9481316.1 mobilization protein [Photobacterium phosphoreum]MCD9485395.1 mobilization protein [Photobacterium phosphoreum]MCD9512993.1 mobilization protein [Photobacterium phosphoreum]